MTSNHPSQPPAGSNRQACKHPRVQIVSRDEDAEYVECLECGDIFDFSEFKDMNIEESAQSSES
jgi:Zn ribbon nucleic-acid-binding protein